MLKVRSLKEKRRQAYLQAMGLQAYYPRRPLPGARPSPVYELEPTRPGNPAPVTARHGPLQRQASAAGESPARPGEGTPTVASNQAGGESSRSRHQAAETPPVQFQVVWYDLGERLALLCEMPASAPRQVTQQCRELLQAILQALSLPGSLDQAATARFGWPLDEDMSAEEASAEHAGQALSGFITKLRERHQATNLLVFGEQLDELLPGAGQAGPARDYEHRPGGYWITRSSALAAMLAMPEIKKDVWHDLQALRKRLAENASDAGA